jgi:hypothetical protein
MKHTDDYGSGHKSSSGESPKYKEGSLDAMQNHKAYKKDMYDNFASIAGKNTTGDGAPNGGIQGGGGGNTGDKSKEISVKGNNGSADYGKGNPYKSKDHKPKQVFKSIQEIREYNDKKGKGY